MKKEILKNFLRRKRKILIFGGGISGKFCAKFFKEKGHQVWISDIKKIPTPSGVDFIEQNQVIKKISGFDLFVLSPGISPEILPVRQAKKAKKIVVGELDLAFSLIPDSIEKVLITGTNGKSTTTALVSHILSKNKRKCIACGNIGNPIFSFLSRLGGDEILAVEVSSYQLEMLARENIRGKVRIFLNFSPDHLSRHKTLERYRKIKERIFENMGKKDTGISKPEVRKKNIFYIGKDIRFFQNRIKFSKKFKESLKIDDIFIEEKKLNFILSANAENLAAASGCAAAFGLSSQEIASAIYSFKPLPHRLEPVKIKNFRTFINDSKATNISSTIHALKNLTGKIVLIVGGLDKGESFKKLLPHLKNVRLIVAYGDARKKIKKELSRKNVVSIQNFEDALKFAWEKSKKGEKIVLSPACASFDQFKNFEERGNFFKKWAEKNT